MTDAKDAVRPRLPPAPRCVLCERPLEAIGGRRLIACRTSRGVLIGTSPNIGGFPKRRVFRLKTGYMLVMGESDRDEWSDEAVDRARQQAEAGYHPWFCQVCGKRTCQACGTPLRFPAGCAWMGDDGGTAQSPLLGANVPCINPDCENATPKGKRTSGR